MVPTKSSFLALFLAISPSIALYKSFQLSIPDNNQAFDQPPQFTHIASPLAEETKQQPQHHDDSFAACLLIMDDNHILIEWLAYHYHVLPLRRLIVAVDPRSRTSPIPILNRYRDRGLMNITEWTDNDFLPKDHSKTRRRLNKKRKPEKIDQLVDLHRDRQSYFISQCLKTFKDEGASWVIHSDTDECILPNYVAQEPYRVHNNNFNTTVYQMIESKKHIDHHLGSTCISLPRLRMGTKESNRSQIEQLVPMRYNASQFQTLRWRWRAEFKDKLPNGLAKAMLDVSRIPYEHLQPDVKTHNPHRPVTQECLVRYMFIDKVKAPFLLHHYGGTWEQWSFRQDARRNLEKVRTWEDYLKLQAFDDGETDHIWPWLSDFVKTTGHNLAGALLRGVGKVPSLDERKLRLHLMHRTPLLKSPREFRVSLTVSNSKRKECS